MNTKTIQANVSTIGDFIDEFCALKDLFKNEKLGKGGFGTVFRAKSKIDGKEYALKILEFINK